MASDVLVGDYLCTGAFRLLVQCSDIRVMGVISDAVQRPCEAELRVVPMFEAEHRPPEGHSEILQRVAPLAEAAGLSGAILAGHSHEIGMLAARFGRNVASAHALALNASMAAAALAAFERARLDANELHTLTGNPQPLQRCVALCGGQEISDTTIGSSAAIFRS